MIKTELHVTDHCSERDSVPCVLDSALRTVASFSVSLIQRRGDAGVLAGGVLVRRELKVAALLDESLVRVRVLGILMPIWWVLVVDHPVHGVVDVEAATDGLRCQWELFAWYECICTMTDCCVVIFRKIWQVFLFVTLELRWQGVRGWLLTQIRWRLLATHFIIRLALETFGPDLRFSVRCIVWSLLSTSVKGWVID